MADSHTIQINVDASRARGELNSLGQSIGNVSSALKAIGSSSGGGNFNNLSRQINDLSTSFNRLKSISGLGSVTREIRDLSSAINGIRAPNASAITGINNLARAARQLNTVRVSRQLASDIQHVSASLSNLRVSASATNNLQRLTHALSQARIDPNLARGLSGLGAAVGNLKGPNAATIRNLQQLIQTLGSANSASIASVARALSQIPQNVHVPRVPRQQSGGGGGHKPIKMPEVPELSHHLRGLENAFSASYQAASLFRTAIGAITLGEFAHGVYEAGNNLMSFRIALDSVASDSGEAGRHFEFVKKTARDLGGSLDDMIPSYQKLSAAMRSLGYSEQAAKETFEGAQKALTANHAAAADQKRFMTELMETFAMGGGHATQVMRGMASHYPQLIGIMQKVLQTDGPGLRKIFEEGGISAKQMIDIIKEAGRQADDGVKEALNHSMAQVNIFMNRFTEMKQKAFDSGFDSGLTTYLKEIGKALDAIGFDDFGAKLGEGFRMGFAGATIFTKALIDNRDVIWEVLKAGIELGGLVMIFKTAAGAAGLLIGVLSSVGKAISAVGTAMMTFQGFSAIFTALSASAVPLIVGLTTIAVLAGGAYVAWKYFGDEIGAMFDWLTNKITKAMKGAVELAALTKSLLAGNSLADSKTIAAAAGAEFDKADLGIKAANIGKTISDGFVDGMKTGISALEGMYQRIGSMFGFNSDFAVEFKKQMDANKPRDAEFGSNQKRYDENAKRDADRLRSDAEKADEINKAAGKLFDKFLPDIKAAKDLKDELKQIKELEEKIAAGGKATYHGLDITKDDVARLKAAAEEKALEHFDPTAIKIRDKMADLSAYSQYGGNKQQYEIEKEILSEKNALKKKGLEMTGQEEEALRRILTLEKEIAKGGSDGFSQWANSQKSAVDGMNDDIKSGLDSVADGIAKIATQGKGQFKSLGEAIRAEFRSVLQGIASNFIRTGIKSLMAEGIKGLDLGNMQGKIKEALGLGQSVVNEATDKIKQMASAEITAGVVYVNGTQVGGAGGVAGAAEKEIAGGAGSAAGGAEQTISAAGGGVESMGGMSLGGLPMSGLAAQVGQGGSVSQGQQALQTLQSLSGITPGSNATADFASVPPAGISQGTFDANRLGIGNIKAPLETAQPNLSPSAPSAPSPAMPSGDVTKYGFGSGSQMPSFGSNPGIGGGITPAKTTSPSEISSTFGKTPTAPGGIGTDSASRFGQGLQPIQPPQPTVPQLGAGKTYAMPDKFNELQKVTPVKPSTPETQIATGDKPLGFLSSKYEGKIGTAGGDGGRAYGKYQFDHEQGGVQRFLKDNPKYAEQFQGLQPGSSAFNQKWRDVAKADPKGFEAAQDATAKKLWYDPAASHAEKLGFKMDDRGIQESVFSGSIQHGGIKKILSQTANRDGFKNMSAEDQINAFYDARTNYVQQHSGLTGKRLDGVLDRYKHERPDALKLSRETSKNGSLRDPSRQFQDHGIDKTPVGSIPKNPTAALGKSNPLNSLKQETDKVAKQFSKSVQESTKPMQKELTNKFSDVGKKITDNGSIHKLSDQFQNLGQETMQGVQGTSQLSGGVENMASTMGQQGTQAVESFEQQIQKLIEQMSKGMGGGMGGIGEALGGLFSEGGYSDSPVSSGSMPASYWAGAPAFAEGTANTSGGGMPAILHPNEAVIPLSRGRSIPVEMKGGAPGEAGTTNHYHMTTNIQSKDADSFRKSAGQVASQMQQMMGRMAARNN